MDTNVSNKTKWTLFVLSILIMIWTIIPLIWMEGTLGRLLREFGLTMSVAIAISAILSLTLTPAVP